jgi:RNA polymerase sigma-70 factor (ECF subfamily)
MSNTRTNQEWLRDLNASGSSQEAAIADLRDLLLRAALYYFNRNLNDFMGLNRDEILQCAEDCAQDALLAVLARLSDFRGDSKFTTWAYRFGINHAMVAARRERWKAISLDELAAFDESHLLEWMRQDLSDGKSPEQSALQAEVQGIIREVILQDLTDKQRQVLSLMVIHDVPLDEAARYFETNRNAVYKLLHDARRKLKGGLQVRGFEVSETLALFGNLGKLLDH